jgi:hypothetical protein
MNLKNKLRKLAGDPAQQPLGYPVNPNDLVHAIAHAEYSVPDEKSYWNDKYWTRTRVKPKWGKYKDKKTGELKVGWINPSTAYGPNQITHGKFDSYIRTEYRRDMRPHRRFYYQTMEPMYKKFSYYGMEPQRPGYHPRWDYGGYGKRFTLQEKQEYKKAMARMMMLDYNKELRLNRNGPRSHQGVLDRVIRRWRGVPYSEDPRYYKAVNSFIRKNYPEYYRGNNGGHKTGQFSTVD